MTSSSLRIKMERFGIFFLLVFRIGSPALLWLWLLGVAPSGRRFNPDLGVPHLTLELLWSSDFHFTLLRRKASCFHSATITSHLGWECTPKFLPGSYLPIISPWFASLLKLLSGLLQAFGLVLCTVSLTHKSVLWDSRAFHMMIAAVHKIIFQTPAGHAKWDNLTVVLIVELHRKEYILLLFSFIEVMVNIKMGTVGNCMWRLCGFRTQLGEAKTADRNKHKLWEDGTSYSAWGGFPGKLCLTPWTCFRWL